MKYDNNQIQYIYNYKPSDIQWEVVNIFNFLRMAVPLFFMVSGGVLLTYTA